ncbi:MAG: hypothetical protein PHT19_08850 [Methylococcus sp.]|nr:hypothetical protein [Methylococcus sp.]
MKKPITAALLAASIQAQAGALDIPGLPSIEDRTREYEMQQQRNEARTRDILRDMERNVQEYHNSMQPSPSLQNYLNAPRGQTICQPTYDGGAVCW